jgi:hypothetical protein
MIMANRMDGLTISGTPGTLTIGSTGISAQTRDTILEQDANVRFPQPFANFRVFDAFATVLPGTAANDDLGIDTGTFGSAPVMLTGGDMKALGATTRRARLEVPVPECYEAAETLTFILTCGMVTTVADTSCTIDLEVYENDKDGTISADLCATAAQSMNSLTFSEKTFTVTATSLAPGDMLDVRVSITCTDAATGTAVTPKIGGFDLVCDIKG